MSNALIPLQDLDRMAQAIASSKLFGITNADQALALMLVAQAEGLHPATAARDYHIISGRPALKSDAMLARYLNSGGKVEWLCHTDEKVEAIFSHPAGGTLTIAWDNERLKKAGLADREMHKKYPRQLKRARVISEGIRATNPAVCVGVYTPEEVQDFEPADKSKRGRPIKDVSDAEVVADDNEKAADSISPPKDAGSSPAPSAVSGPPAANDALLMLGREWAEAGTTKYAAWWEKLAPNQQKAIGKKRHDEYWQIAEKADEAIAGQG